MRPAELNDSDRQRETWHVRPDVLPRVLELEARVGRTYRHVFAGQRLRFQYRDIDLGDTFKRWDGERWVAHVLEDHTMVAFCTIDVVNWDGWEFHANVAPDAEHLKIARRYWATVGPRAIVIRDGKYAGILDRFPVETRWQAIRRWLKHLLTSR